MKKGFNTIIISFLFVILTISGINNVSAAPDTITPYEADNLNYVGLTRFGYKLSEDDGEAYCISGLNIETPVGRTLTRAEQVDSVVAGILDSRNNLECPSDVECAKYRYYFSELAIMRYLGTQYSSSMDDDRVTAIINWGQEAAAAFAEVDVTVDSYSPKMTLNSDGYFYSDNITFHSNKDVADFNVDTSASYDVISKDSTSITIRFKIANNAFDLKNISLSATVSASSSHNVYYYYRQDNPYYQDLAFAVPDVVSEYDAASATVTATRTTLSIVKRDSATHNPLTGASMRLLASDKKTVIREWTSDGSAYTLDGLMPGTYYVQEVKAPTGYKLNQDLISITLNAEATEVVYMDNTKNSITISKVELMTSEELPGASLIITNESGKVLYNWISTDKPYVIEAIPVGTYYLEEILAPTGYKLNKTKIKFKVTELGELKQIDSTGKETTVDKLVMKNEITKLSITKVDATNNKELPGATLQLLDKDGKVLHEWISTEEAFVIEGLVPGEYFLIETIAPEGYIQSSEKITITVNEDGTVKPVIMKNTPIIEVPDTLSGASITLIIAGIIVVLSGGFIVYKNVQKNKEV